MKCRNCLLIGSLFMQLTFHGVVYAEMVSIKGDDINMRSGPGTNQPVLYTLRVRRRLTLLVVRMIGFR